MKKLDKINKKIISASQIQNFISCPKKWYFEKILKISQPSTDAFADGRAFHAIVESIYKGQKITKDYKKSILEMVKIAWTTGIFEEGFSDNLLIEKKIELPVDEHHYLIGYIDMLDIENHIIADQKTCADFKWAETEESLRNNLQLLIYGKYYIDFYNTDYVYFRHNQVLKNDPKQSKYIQIKVTRDEIEDFWEKKILIASKWIHRVRQMKNVDDVKENINSCSNYGGCHLLKRSVCDPKPLDLLFG